MSAANPIAEAALAAMLRGLLERVEQQLGREVVDRVLGAVTLQRSIRAELARLAKAPPTLPPPVPGTRH